MSDGWVDYDLLFPFLGGKECEVQRKRSLMICFLPLDLPIKNVSLDLK